MPVIRTGYLPEDIETKRWDTPKSQGGMKPDGYEPWPVMLYRCRRLSNGNVVCLEEDPVSLQPYTGTTLIVGDERERDRALAQGWRQTPPEAYAYLDRWEQEVATAAAEANAAALRMSEKAQTERKAREKAAAPHHVTE